MARAPSGFGSRAAQEINPPVGINVDFEALRDTVKKLENMQMPISNPSRWNREMRQVYGAMLGSIGNIAAKTARSVLLGASYGNSGQIESQLARAHPLTQQLRRASKNPHPLKDQGTLARNIRATVAPNSASVMIGVPPGKKTKSRSKGPKQEPIEMAQLLMNFETGFDIRITDRSRAAFLYYARELETRAAGGPQTGGKLMAEAAKAQKEAVAWRKLALVKDGILHVPARPVLKPSMEYGLKQFMESGVPDFMKNLAKVWILGKRQHRTGRTSMTGMAAGVG